jgi:putative tricarboxylic transport membrane protein
MSKERQWSLAGLLIGLGLLAVAAVIAADAAGMRVPPVHAKVGPRFFPYLVALGLAFSGALLAWQSWRGQFEAEGVSTDWLAVAAIVAGLIVHVSILKTAGFVPAATLLFVSVTFAFGSRRPGRDVAIGVMLALITYLGFTRALGLPLPAGLLSGVL